VCIIISRILYIYIYIFIFYLFSISANLDFLNLSNIKNYFNIYLFFLYHFFLNILRDSFLKIKYISFYNFRVLIKNVSDKSSAFLK